MSIHAQESAHASGPLTVTEAFITVGAGRTWYRTSRGPAVRDDAVPLLMLHGGPGGASLNGVPFVERVAQDRLVVEYDQLDCGRSDRVSDPGRWTVDALVEELGRVREALGLDQVHLWGQSWGGMLAIAYLLTRPQGVVSATTSGSPMCLPAYVEEAWRLRADLPAYLQRAMARGEAALAKRPHPLPPAGPGPSSEWATKAGKKTARFFSIALRPWVQRVAAALTVLPPLRRPLYDVVAAEMGRRHVGYGLDITNPPPGLLEGFSLLNTAMYQAMWGPSEFHGTGPIAQFDVLDRLHEIDTPVLLTSGAHEITSPAQMGEAADRLPNATWVLFQHSSHVQPYEEPERYTQVLLEFLAAVEARRQ